MPVFEDGESDEPAEGDSPATLRKKMRRRIERYEEELGIDYGAEVADYERTMDSLRRHGE